MAKVNMVPADLFVKSNLTYQPKTVVSRFRKFVQKQDSYNVGMRQDFEKNKVENFCQMRADIRHFRLVMFLWQVR